MSALDDIIDQIRDQAGADFAFILSRRARLVTRHAPENMPEEGRAALVAVAEPLLGSDRVALRTMPREALVPYGGAAPVDVFVGAREAAIVCVVMATWSDQSQVMAAIESGFASLDRLIGNELAKRGGDTSRRKKSQEAPPAPGSQSGRAGPSRRPPTAPPSSRSGATAKEAAASASSQQQKVKAPWGRAANRRTMIGVDDPSSAIAKARISTPIPKAPGSSSGRSAAKGRTQRPPPFAMPAPKNRTQRPPAMGAPVAEAKEPGLGRGTLPFIPGDSSPTQQALRALANRPRATAPEITVGEARIGHATLVAIELEASSPQISFGAAPLGRETLAAIDASVVPQGSAKGSAPDLRVTLASMPDIDPEELEPLDRHTLPFTETASDAKRAYDLAAKRRGVEPPDVRVRLATLDFDTKTAVLEEKNTELAEAAKRARQKAEAQSKRNSNIDAWHDALTELVGDENKSARKKPRAK